MPQPTPHLYLSGAMTGLPDYNKPAFHRLAAALRHAGHQVLNPAELDIADPAEKTWREYLTRDLSALLATCNAVAVMPGWDRSKGAVLECAVACALGMPIHPVDHFLDTTKMVPPIDPILIFQRAFEFWACVPVAQAKVPHTA